MQTLHTNQRAHGLNDIISLHKNKIFCNLPSHLFVCILGDILEVLLAISKMIQDYFLLQTRDFDLLFP